MRKLGLIGGLGPGATVHYYQELCKANAGEMMMVQADMKYGLSHVERGDLDGLAAYFARLIERLAQGGADFAVIPAVTPHICIRQLEKISPLPLVNIIKVTEAELHARGYRKVALFGTRFVVQSRMFGMLEDIEVVVPDDVEEIHKAYMQTVDGETGSRDTLIGIANRLEVDAVVLAGTDLAVIFNESNTPFPHVDCAKLHIAAILQEIHS